MYSIEFKGPASPYGFGLGGPVRLPKVTMRRISPTPIVQHRWPFMPDPDATDLTLATKGLELPPLGPPSLWRRNHGHGR